MKPDKSTYTHKIRPGTSSHAPNRPKEENSPSEIYGKQQSETFDPFGLDSATSSSSSSGMQSSSTQRPDTTSNGLKQVTARSATGTTSNDENIDRQRSDAVLSLAEKFFEEVSKNSRATPQDIQSIAYNLYAFGKEKPSPDNNRSSIADITRPVEPTPSPYGSSSLFLRFDGLANANDNIGHSIRINLNVNHTHLESVLDVLLSKKVMNLFVNFKFPRNETHFKERIDNLVIYTYSSKEEELAEYLFAMSNFMGAKTSPGLRPLMRDGKALQGATIASSHDSVGNKVAGMLAGLYGDGTSWYFWKITKEQFRKSVSSEMKTFTSIGDR